MTESDLGAAEDKEEPTDLEIGQMFGRYLASSEHRCDSGAMSWQVVLEFNIKERLLDFPDDWDDFEICCPVCESKLFDTEDLYIQEARRTFDAAAHDLKDRFPWISEVCQAGRSGGWLLVVIPWPESKEKLKGIDGQLPEVKKFIDSVIASFKERGHWVKAMSTARDEYSIITESKRREP